jgi:hypothetical protein
MDIPFSIYWTAGHSGLMFLLMIAPVPSGPISLLTIQFLAWLAERPRPYADVMEAWRSSCPRLTVWEDSVTDDLVRCDRDRLVSLTPRGRAALERGATESGAMPG